MPDPDLEKIVQILNANKNLNFVQRILNPGSYPTIDLGDGRYGTHLMSYANGEDGAFAYPNITYDETTGQLTNREPSDAMGYAVKNKQYIKFPSSDEADWFTRNYKRVWEK
jgi:hypothetical protein